MLTKHIIVNLTAICLRIKAQIYHDYISVFEYTHSSTTSLLLQRKDIKVD